MAQVSVQPRVGLGCLGPDPFVQAGKDQKIGALYTGLQRAPDQDAGMRLKGIAHLMARQDRMEKAAVIGCVDRATGGGALTQRRYRRQCLAPVVLVPKLPGGLAGWATRQGFGQCDMVCKT